MRPNPRPQEIYRHFKGNIYQIITLARHSEDGMKMVVYQQMYAPYEVYVRPLEMFMSRIDTALRNLISEVRRTQAGRERIRMQVSSLR